MAAPPPPSTPIDTDDAKRETVGFVTGTLAEYALGRTLERLAPEVSFEPRALPLRIAVAALMTTDWVARHLNVPDGIERLVLPGYCRGDLGDVERATGLPVERGPNDLRDLPAYYGRQPSASDYGAFAIEIVAEINHVPQLELAEVLRVARRYREAGADVIDVGCDPGGPFRGVADVVRELRAEGFRISIDSLDPVEIEAAVDAGAELVLSVRRDNLDVARDLPCEFVVIPDDPSTLDGLRECAEALAGWGKRFRLDPVIEPIGFGFAESLGRYVETRREFPDAEILMGVGNVTELTGADSAPINVLLLGFCEELGIRSVLTTEVIHWARSSVRECNLARRLVHYAVRHGAIPKHVEPQLHLLRDAKHEEHGIEVIERLASTIRDRNFRVFAEGDEIHVLSRGRHARGRDPFEIFETLGVEDASHAFYLGYEMCKAVTAITLGKDYEQDRALRWGFLTREESSHLDRARNPSSEDVTSEPNDPPRADEEPNA